MKGLLILCALVALSAAWKTYKGYQVYKVTPHSLEQLKFLAQMHEDFQLDFWKESRAVGDYANVIVHPERITKFKAKLIQHGLSLELVVPDLGVQVAEEKERLSKKKAFDLNDFNTYEDITSQLRVWESACAASGLSCSITSLGNSHEGRAIETFSMSTGGAKQEVWIDGLIHPREYIVGSTILYFIDHMVNNYGSDADVSNLLDSYDWTYVPVMNPDGYEFTWTDDRMWRKNREPNSGSACIGTDLNRNYDNGYWGWSGTSTSPCSDTYGGPSAGSAVETQIIQDELTSRSGNLRLMVSNHGVASMWLHSWGQATQPGGNQCDIADDEADLMRVGQATINAIEAEDADGNANDWVAGSVCTTIYPASGGTVDYAYSRGIKYSYTPELRAGAGFIPPPSEIVPSFQETWAGYVAMIAEIEAIEG